MTRHVLVALLVSEVICGALALVSPRLFGVPPRTTSWHGTKVFQCPVSPCPKHLREGRGVQWLSMHHKASLLAPHKLFLPAKPPPPPAGSVLSCLASLRFFELVSGSQVLLPLRTPFGPPVEEERIEEAVLSISSWFFSYGDQRSCSPAVSWTLHNLSSSEVNPN